MAYDPYEDALPFGYMYRKHFLKESSSVFLSEAAVEGK